MRIVRALLRAPAGHLLLGGAAALAAVGVAGASVLPGPPWLSALAALAVLGLAAAALRFRALLRLTGYLLVRLRRSLPAHVDRDLVSGLEHPVTIELDRLGVPTIVARSRRDAWRALGYVTARDRLFQMDLLRRTAGGQLSEVFGPATLDADIAQRVLGLHRACEEILRALPEPERALLERYAEGVNSYLERARSLPFECLVLKYRPRPWTAGSSILVLLGMFQRMCGDERSERMLTVMERSLPADVVAFLTPDGDGDAGVLAGGRGSRRPMPPIPVQSLAALIRDQARAAPGLPDDLVQPDAAPIGSNGWAVHGSRTRGGGAILANDMHLPLEVPNLWYRARLRYEEIELTGVLVPGLPIVAAGSNGRVAWGLTNAAADCLDLVELETRSAEQDEYRTPDGWRPFGSVREVIAVRGREPHLEEVLTTIWGPVSRRPLMGRRVAIRWTALDPAAVNCALLHLDAAADVDAAIAVGKASGAPPVNLMVADRAGNIGWTLSGKIPIRAGLDGSSARSWADEGVGWTGYIPAAELPSITNPTCGFVATANNRTLGAAYPYVVGHDFAHACRVHRIDQVLRDLPIADAPAMHDLQLDTQAQLHERYRDVALEVLTEPAAVLDPELAEVRALLEAWDGKADPGSLAMPVVDLFRRDLARACLGPLVAACRAADERFVYAWGNLDAPLGKILTARPPELVPDPERHADWAAFLRSCLRNAVRAWRAQGARTWGELNRVSMVHPLAGVLRPLAGLLDMPPDLSGGCQHCVRVSTPRFGATTRMIVVLDDPQGSTMEMPGGQSEHPLSVSFSDQHRPWIGGERRPFAPGPTVRRTVLTPGGDAG